MGIAALAGVLSALAMLTKQTSLIFLAGPLAVALLRGGWRNWRGILAFAAALGIVAGPWYVYHRHELNSLVSLHDSGATTSAYAKSPIAIDGVPTRTSLASRTQLAHGSTEYSAR